MDLVVIVTIVTAVIIIAVGIIIEVSYNKLATEVLRKLGFSSWNIVQFYDDNVIVKSRKTLEKYDDIKYFKENEGRLTRAEKIFRRKCEVSKIFKGFLDDNEYKKRFQYGRLRRKIHDVIIKSSAFRVKITYISSAGNNLGERDLILYANDINKFTMDPSLLMGKGEYNKYLKEQQKEELGKKQYKYYNSVNSIIDYANENREILILKNGQEQLDSLITQLFDRTVNSIKKIKMVNSEEWNVISDFIEYIGSEIRKIVGKNQRIIEYYESSDFLKIKQTCEILMSTQREFNEYITEKVESVSRLFGTRIVRNATINNDEYNYIRPYKKSITPFTAEVSASVFASAENNPLEYVVKNFYPDKKLYNEQIQKLYILVEELETLREAKEIIENYKAEYQQYLGDVPDYIMEEDSAGFYSRLGFANIDESVLVVEYKFSYTSGGGMAQRSFTVPMTEETIIELIKVLESKLTASAFVKEQRMLMTKKMRESIKNRDNFTCCNCGNSTYKVPNLLLEIDHIIPVTKGDCTIEENLQTLCWKCNRSKSNKVL
jgi:hypothetical protein